MTDGVPDWLREELAKQQAELSELADTPYNERRRARLGKVAEMIAVIDQSSVPRHSSNASSLSGASACRHATTVEVRNVVTDELVAHLCPDCGAQLPAEKR